MVRCGHSQTGSTTYSTTPPWWGSCRSTSARAGCVRSGSPDVADARGAADLSVAQAVVDEGEKFASDRDPCDVHPAPFADASIVALEFRAAAHVRDRFDRSPAHQRRSCFGDPPAAHLGIRFSMSRREPSPRTKTFGLNKQSHLA